MIWLLMWLNRSVATKSYALTYINIYTYIYIYRERERERERDWTKLTTQKNPIH